jgi:hypothetical protein
MSDHRQSEPIRRRSALVSVEPGLLSTTADASNGSSNLATVPRAGNISSDTRAGRSG